MQAGKSGVATFSVQPHVSTIGIGYSGEGKSPPKRLVLQFVQGAERLLLRYLQADIPEVAKDFCSVLMSAKTVEAAVKHASERGRFQEEGLLSLNDEGSGFHKMLGQYNGGKNSTDRPVIIEMMDGDKVNFGTKGEGVYGCLEQPMLNVANGLQPELAAQFGEDNDDGLMNRFKTTVPVPPSNTSQADRDQLLLSSLQYLLSI